MKPLQKTKLNEFLERFDNFKECEFRSFKVINPTQLSVVFGVQDKAKEFDWITLELEFSGVSDARLIEESKMSLVDMSDGISILVEDDNFAFGIGSCQNLSCITNATYYIKSETIKYNEGSF